MRNRFRQALCEQRARTSDDTYPQSSEDCNDMKSINQLENLDLLKRINDESLHEQ